MSILDNVKRRWSVCQASISFFVATSVWCGSISAAPSEVVFAKFPNKYLVETGTFWGTGIETALKAGFQEVYSIEIAPNYYGRAVEKFKDQPNVHLVLGDSALVLGDVIQNINSPITFWLDGHYSMEDTGRGSSNSPILQELDIIKRHPIKTHTIMIDDARLFGTEAFDHVTTFQIISKLHEINPDYEIKYEHGHIHHDILVAYLPK